MKIFKIFITILIILFIGFLIYLPVNQYSATDEAIVYTKNYAIENNNYYEFDNSSQTGLIVYPGAKVDARAYSYLSNVDANVYIARFPANLAILQPNIATTIIAENPKIDSWYILGHSLGGTVAYSYASNNEEIIKGIILLASYPAQDYSDVNFIPTLAFFGTDDGIITDYKEKEKLLPKNSELIEIKGANHSNFANYGLQKKDNKSSISNKQQQEIVIENINEFIK